MNFDVLPHRISNEILEIDFFLVEDDRTGARDILGSHGISVPITILERILAMYPFG
jgi:hypothetical protein